ncbi:MAG: tRNA nucleotidyltransferase [Firmicutes bacterium]|nr:tRNA nucleotidyltransferase [Bacillota bacterium]
MNNIAEKIAYMVSERGGRTFYVGGFVRDKILGIENKDMDIEVHGIQPAVLREILSEVGEPISYGSSFGVYSLKGYDIDIAMPRKEHATGKGHRDFEVFVDPFIGTAEAARRRDFTMNAVMEDVLTGELVDPFGGKQDLEKGIIRHIDSDTFVEDPLRVLRGAQFASRFGFNIADDTSDLFRSMDLSALSMERVEDELKKALLKGKEPSVFFEVLRSADGLDVWFPEVKALIGIEQDPKFHPEGDVWTHTMEVLDRAARYRYKTKNPYAFMLLALTHDFGKAVTTEVVNGRIHAYDHETEGLPAIETFLRRITNESEVISYVLNMVPLHMKPNVVAASKSAVKVTNRMFDRAAAPEDLIYFAMSDKPVMSGDNPFTGDPEFLFERYELYEEMMSRPYVTGNDLIEKGLEPGEYFSDVLAYAHKLRLAGTEKESALKQTLAYARKRR